MQFTDEPARIPPLPQPGLVERLTLESPMALVLSLAVIGLAGLIIFNNRGRAGTGLSVLGVAWLLAGAALLVALLVETPRERLMDRTRELVAALAGVDTNALSGMIDEDATVEVRGVRSFEGRDSIIRGAEQYIGSSTRIESHRVPEIQAVIDGPNAARTQVRVRHSGNSVPPASWWRITWYRVSESEPWVAIEIEPLWITGLGNF